LQRAKKATIVGRLNVSFPKLFLRLRTEFQTSDFPMTLAKWLFIKSAIDSIGLAFYHHHREFLRVLGQNPPISAIVDRSNVMVLSQTCRCAVADSGRGFRQRHAALLKRPSNHCTKFLRILRMRRIFHAAESPITLEKRN
jgi:hypothetical protein